jgi:3alpha(or 20beta)-hydroxysteroid dehydrogenase
VTEGKTMFELNGKTAVVTGAASGIGRAVAERFAAAGAQVMCGDLADATGLAGAIGGAYLRCDVSDEQSVAALMKATAELGGGRIDIVVNNAGITVEETEIAETTLASLQRAFAVNSAGALLGIKHAAPYLTGGGAIVNTSSLAAVLGTSSYAAYSASKAAVLAITRVAAMELGPAGIRVNAICPSSVDTPMLRNQELGEIEEAVTRRAAPLGVTIQPEQVAALVHFLVADDCPVISGQAINIDAGTSAGISNAIIESVLAGTQEAVA